MRQALHGGVCRMELEHEEDAEKLVPGELFQLMGIRDGISPRSASCGARGVGGVEMVRMLDAGIRQNLRIPVRFESFLYPISGSWKGRAAIVSRDLSCGGIAFLSEKQLKVGEICEIVIPVTTEPLVLKLKILRAEKRARMAFPTRLSSRKWCTRRKVWCGRRYLVSSWNWIACLLIPFLLFEFVHVAKIQAGFFRGLSGFLCILLFWAFNHIHTFLPLIHF